jgi:hypothetical protein
VWTCIVVAVLAAIPFIQYSGAGIIAIAATGMIYLSYFLGNIAILRPGPRLAQEQRAVPAGPLGPAGQHRRACSTAGRCWSTSPGRGRPATRAEADRRLLSLHLELPERIPILWTVVVVIALIGAIYYLIVGRTKRSRR